MTIDNKFLSIHVSRVSQVHILREAKSKLILGHIGFLLMKASHTCCVGVDGGSHGDSELTLVLCYARSPENLPFWAFFTVTVIPLDDKESPKWLRSPKTTMDTHDMSKFN